MGWGKKCNLSTLNLAAIHIENTYRGYVVDLSTANKIMLRDRIYEHFYR